MKRTLLALLTTIFVLQLAAQAQSGNSRLSEKQLLKAESLINQLEQLDSFVNRGPDSGQYKARIRKLSAAFSSVASSLPDSDVKTDLSTSVYWYEQLAIRLNHSNNSASVALRCNNERPGAYQKLCESTSGSARDLIWAKARLHMKWASADIVFQKTGDVGRPLDDIAVERRVDQTLAARVIESLKLLEREVFIYHSLADFEASGKLARVSFAEFKRDLERVSADAESALSWLPQNRLKLELSNALHSFQDGAFWWEQVDQPRVVKASDLVSKDLNRSLSEATLMTTVPYTIAINWRHGSQYLKRAEKMISS